MYLWSPLPFAEQESLSSLGLFLQTELFIGLSPLHLPPEWRPGTVRAKSGQACCPGPLAEIRPVFKVRSRGHLIGFSFQNCSVRRLLSAPNSLSQDLQGMRVSSNSPTGLSQASSTVSPESDQENHRPQSAACDGASGSAAAPGSVQPLALCDGTLRRDALKACALASVARMQLEAVSPVSLLS